MVELKKKNLSTNVIKLDEFISETFYYNGIVYVSTLRRLERIDLDTMVREVWSTFATPTELLYVDSFGSFMPRNNSNTK